MTTPLFYLRRTPLRRLLDGAGAAWRELGDTAIADRFGEPLATSNRLAIADLTPLPRLGFKGPGTIVAMRARGVTLEATPNRAFRQADGGLCLVLGLGEVMLLSNLAGDHGAFDALFDGWRIEDEERTYPLLRRDSHAWFAVLGADAPALLAKLCAVDLRLARFPDLTVAQTSVARMSAIVARADIGKTPVYHILADSAATVYLYSCLMDAAAEFAGGGAGLGDIKDLGGA